MLEKQEMAMKQSAETRKAKKPEMEQVGLRMRPERAREHELTEIEQGREHELMEEEQGRTSGVEAKELALARKVVSRS